MTNESTAVLNAIEKLEVKDGDILLVKDLGVVEQFKVLGEEMWDNETGERRADFPPIPDFIYIYAPNGIENLDRAELEQILAEK
jgi:hypothetical protein